MAETKTLQAAIDLVGLAEQPSGPVRATFRLISADTVLRTWTPMVITAAALRDALPLFQPSADVYGRETFLPVRVDHDRSVRSVVGKVVAARWVDAAGAFPAGIDGDIEVDPELDPRVAKALMSGLIRSGSVSIECDYDDDDSVALVTAIRRVSEFSLVDSGADPFARRLDAQEVRMDSERVEQAEAEAPAEVETVEAEPVELAEPDAEIVERMMPADGLVQAAEAERDAAIASLRAEVARSKALAEERDAARAELAQSNAKVAELESTIRASKKRAMLTEAVRCGRIQAWEQDELADLPDAKLASYLARRPAGSAVPMGVDAPAESEDFAEAKNVPTEQQRKIAAQLGIDPEKVYTRTV